MIQFGIYFYFINIKIYKIYCNLFKLAIKLIFQKNMKCKQLLKFITVMNFLFSKIFYFTKIVWKYIILDTILITICYNFNHWLICCKQFFSLCLLHIIHKTRHMIIQMYPVTFQHGFCNVIIQQTDTFVFV